MSNWKYITLVALALVGGAFLFRVSSLNSFNTELSKLEANLNTALSLSAASTTKVAPTTESLSTSTLATTFKLTFPQKGGQLYMGCTYDISWNSSTTVTSINLSLVDAGTGKASGPVASGLASSTEITSLETVSWKIGSIWPGEYYVLASNVNGETLKQKTGTFTILENPTSGTSLCAIN